MNESSCIDSPLRGRAMPKSYSGDLRERVIEAVEGGASRRETAERFEVSVSSAVKWLQRWHESKSTLIASSLSSAPWHLTASRRGGWQGYKAQVQELSD